MRGLIIDAGGREFKKPERLALITLVDKACELIIDTVDIVFDAVVADIPPVRLTVGIQYAQVGIEASVFLQHKKNVLNRLLGRRRRRLGTGGGVGWDTGCGDGFGCAAGVAPPVKPWQPHNSSNSPNTGTQIRDETFDFDVMANRVTRLPVTALAGQTLSGAGRADENLPSSEPMGGTAKLRDRKIGGQKESARVAA